MLMHIFAIWKSGMDDLFCKTEIQRHRGQMYGHQERKWGCEGLGDQK